MSTQQVAKVAGVVFVLVGLLGYILGGFGMETHMLLGLFPVNVVHNAVHLGIGAWALTAARSAAGATNFCKIGGVLYLLLGCLGFVVADPAFGLVPLGGNDRWLHLALGAVLAYYGFVRAKSAAPMGA